MYEGIDFGCITIAIEADAIDIKCPDTGMRHQVIDFSYLAIAIKCNDIDLSHADTAAS